LVKTNLLKVVAGILLEDEPPVSPEDVCLVECPHYLLDQVQVADAFRQRGLWLIVVYSKWQSSNSKSLFKETYLLGASGGYTCLATKCMTWPS
jgi:hypothetical protein